METAITGLGKYQGRWDPIPKKTTQVKGLVNKSGTENSCLRKLWFINRGNVEGHKSDI